MGGVLWDAEDVVVVVVREVVEKVVVAENEKSKSLGEC
jgi:hypothetical protein